MSSRNISLLLAFSVFCVSSSVSADPACVDHDEKNFVVAYVNAGGGQLLIESVNSSARFFMRPCSGALDNNCYFAENVKPGRYHFQEMIYDRNDIHYPVASAKMWFDIVPMGASYIGDWYVERDSTHRVIKLEVQYKLKSFDAAVQLCGLKKNRLFVSAWGKAPSEIVD